MAISLSSRYKRFAAIAVPPATALDRSGRPCGGQFFQQRPEFGGVQRLVEEIGRAELRRGLAHAGSGMIAVDDFYESGAGRVVDEVLEHAKPVALAQLEIQDHHVAGLTVQPG